jgi:hypothetical protein
MPEIRPISCRLIPLRDPRAPYGRSLSKTLLTQHQSSHPGEGMVNPAIQHLRPGTIVGGYFFYNRFVETARVENRTMEGHVGQLVNLKPLALSEVAALALEKTFGKAATEEDVFTTDWGSLENRHPGHLFWEEGASGEIDRIVARTREGFTLTMEGTNIVEAAVYLPRMYDHLLSRLPEIKEGVQQVEVRIEGNREEWSQSNSPLHIKSNLPNLANADHELLNQIVKNALDRALQNRL